MEAISYYIDVGRLIQPNAVSEATKGSGDRLMIHGSILTSFTKLPGSIQLPTGSGIDVLLIVTPGGSAS